MKKWMFGLGLAAVIAMPVVAAAQSAVGVRAGMRWSELESSQDAGTISALVLGGYFGFGISNRLALQIEAVYGTRGAQRLKVGTDALDADATAVELHMSYVEVPLLLRAGFPGERFLPSFFLGPYVGFLLDCEFRPAGGDSQACDEEGAPQRFSPRSTDFGLVVGGGLDMAMGESTVFVDGRYTMGLMSIQTGNGFDARHGGLALSAGVAVPLGR